MYADIMGFSHRVTTNNHENLKNKLLEFKKKWLSKSSQLKIGGQLKTVQFSDSILVVVNGTDAEMLDMITKAAACLMQSAMSLGFPIKGVIAQGKFTYDSRDELYFGLPLVEAYTLHEEIQYYGIVVHHSAEQVVKKYKDILNLYSKTKVNLKKGKTSHYHLSWHLMDEQLNRGNIKTQVNNWLDMIEESVSGAPRIYVDNTREVIQSDERAWSVINEKKSKGTRKRY